MAQQKAARRDSLREQDGPPADAPAPVSRILLVDDDAQLLRTSAIVLSNAGFEVETCGDPAEALSCFIKGAPDLLLLDVHFDERHAAEGFDFLRKLRGLGYQGLVVIWSGDCSLAMAHEAVRAGANGYLLKCDINLVKLLRNLLREGREHDALPPSAETYLRTRGLSDQDIALLREYCVDYDSEKCLAARLDRNYQTVRTQFKRIRDLLRARTLGDLARILGVLSCFAQRYRL